MAGTMGMMTQLMQQPSRQPVPMQITVFGTGYVGLVTGACLAEVGNDVVCVDIAADRVAQLNSGEVPFFEPGLLELVERNHTAGRLRFITDEKRAIAHGRIFFITVGTPPSNDGSADLSHVLAVARSLGLHLQGDAVIVSKSTVPVGTADRIKRLIAEELSARSVQIPFLVVSSPEFLKEGDAIKDCMQPDRIIIGTDSPLAVELLKELYHSRDDARRPSTKTLRPSLLSCVRSTVPAGMVTLAAGGRTSCTRTSAVAACAPRSR